MPTWLCKWWVPVAILESTGDKIGCRNAVLQVTVSNTATSTLCFSE